MLQIKHLSKQIKNIICQAEEYARCALEYKETDKILADFYYTKATERIKDIDDTHEQVVRLITAYRKEKGEPPAAMQALYDYIHEEQIENVREVRVLMEMYKS